MRSDIPPQTMLRTHTNTWVLRATLLVAGVCLVIEVVRLNVASTHSGAAPDPRVDGLISANRELIERLQKLESAPSVPDGMEEIRKEASLAATQSRTAQTMAQEALAQANAAKASALSASQKAETARGKNDNVFQLGLNRAVTILGPRQAKIQLGFNDEGGFLDIFGNRGTQRVAISSDHQHPSDYCVWMMKSSPRDGWIQCNK